MYRRRGRWLTLLGVAILGIGFLTPASRSAAQGASTLGLPPGINVAVTRPATASSETGSNPAARAVDGDVTTRWCAAAGAGRAQLTVTLDGLEQLTGTAVTWATQAPANYSVQISVNGQQWNDLPATRSNSGSLTWFDSVTGRAAPARYVRLSFTGGTLPCVSEFRVFASPQEASRLIRGVDLSTLRAEEAAGNSFSDAAGTRPAEQILADHGANLVRLRLWVDPPNGYNNLADVAAMAQRIKQAHMQFLLDIHYSDFWADPGKQNTPARWQGQDLPTLANTVLDYTRSAIETLTGQGTPPDMVQIGNEITAGMLWPVGKLYVGSQQRWVEFTTLLKAGIAGAKEGAPPGRAPLIMIHIDRGGDQGGSQ